MQFRFKQLLIFVIFLFNILSASSTLFDEPYILTTESPLHEKFDYYSETEFLECYKSSCDFNAALDTNLGSVILILAIAFFLAAGLIGHNPDHEDPYGGSSYFSEEHKEKINQRPLQWGKALAVFVIALYLVKFVRADLVDKHFDLSNHLLTLKKAGTDEIVESIPFQTMASFELMNYHTEVYRHYELNLRLKSGKRIHLYASRDYLSPTLMAIELSQKMGMDVKKVVYTD